MTLPAATPGLTRRQMLQAAPAGALAIAALPGGAWTAMAAGGPQRLVLTPAPAEVAIIGGDYPKTAVWGYDADLPGPTIRARQGERVEIEVLNRLPVPTTVHWHGLRVPNAMDGVPHLTQPPIAPGESFRYAFDLPDAGTYWYHPHFGSAEQLGRGLYGAFIVEAPDAPAVDRELVWLLDDWRMDETAQIVDSFGNFHDASHNGRLGNTVTVNGRYPADLAVAAGERVRLRLINAANARIFSLDFEGHAPLVIALDGHPVPPQAPEGGRVVLAPSQRVDLLLDLSGAPGSRHRVIDDAYESDRYRLLDLVYGDEPRGGGFRAAPAAAAGNPLAEPDLEGAERQRVVFGGGMMAPALQRGEIDMDRMRAEFGEGRIWTLNGESRLEHDAAPMMTFARGRSVRLALINDTVFDHPIHLHGHAFRVLSQNGADSPGRPWRDTLLLAPGDDAEIAFVADNPGDWMFHCHIPEHLEAGMMATLRVL